MPRAPTHTMVLVQSSMFSQLASVFASSGVVLPGSERIPVYKKAGAEAPCDHKNDCSCFAPKFEQASAKLELSKQAVAQMEETREDRNLTGDEKQQVRDMRQRDREVKAHEAAHKASAGGNAKGAAGYEYQVGPDGKQYAVGGHVDIDMSPIQGSPEGTLQKARAVQRAATAPADPSGQDRAVAAAAAQMAAQAQKQIAQEGPTNGTGNGKAGEAPDSSRDPRRAYGREPLRTGAVLSIVA
jgi:SprA family protein